MQFITFKSKMRDYPVFTTHDLRSLEVGFDLRRLYEWQQKGYIRKIARGCYVFADAPVDENLLMRVANRLYRPSYVSLETALARHRLIPEQVYAMTSVSTRRTYAFDTPLGRFSYRTVHRGLFFGYQVVDGGVRLATPEKALLDYFHLNPSLTSGDDFESLRIDRDVLREQADTGRLIAYLDRAQEKRLASRVRDFMEWAGHA